MENNSILPNIHFKNPRTDIKGFAEKRLQVVTEKTEINDQEFLAGINSFGFGGSNGHLLLRWNNKRKINAAGSEDNLPRLVCISGREENSITTILDDIKMRPLDAEYISLYHQIFRKNVPNHLYRGYSIVTKSGGEFVRSAKFFDANRKRLYIAFGDCLNSWNYLAKELLILPFLSNSIQRVHSILSKYGVDIKQIFFEENNNSVSISNKILGSMVVQIIITDLIKILKIEPHGYFGYGLGEFICAYFEGALDLDQILLVSYKMAQMFGNIESYISESNKRDKLSLKSLFYLGDKSIRSYLFKQLLKIVENPKRKNNLWLSHLKSQNTSTEYFLDAFCVNKSHLKNINNDDSIILDTGDKILLELQKNRHIRPIYFNLKPGTNENYFLKILKILGSLYEYGYNSDFDKLYPKVEYPVSRGTPMISPLIKWNHKHDWFVACYDSDIESPYKYSVKCSLKDDKWSFLLGHEIDGRKIFPATGYFNLLYEGFLGIKKAQSKNLQIIIENCQFLRATSISKDVDLEFNVDIQKRNGHFEILDGETVVVMGKVKINENASKDQISFSNFDETEIFDDRNLTCEDIYKEFKIRGYNYSGAFKKIVGCNSDLTKALIKWDGNWVTFMDNMLQLNILQTNSRNLYVPTMIKYCSIDFKKHLEYIDSFNKTEPMLTVYFDKNLNMIRCGGIEIRNIIQVSVERRKSKKPLLEYYSFIGNRAKLNLEDSIRINMQIIEENIYDLNVKCVELYDEPINRNFDILSPLIYRAFNDMPEIVSKITVLSKKQLNYSECEIKNANLTNESYCDLVVVKNIFKKIVILQHSFSALKDNGFILTCEPLDFQFNSLKYNGIECLTEFETENEKILLLRKTIESKWPISIKISNENFDWIAKLQKAMKNDFNIIVYSQHEPISGILGFIFCIKREPNGNKIRSIFLQDDAPPFDPNNDFYKNQLNKNLIVNVYQNSKWGTYRHLILNESEDAKGEHFYANTLIKTDLSSFRWIEGPLNSKTILPPEQELIYVYYGALNFKDILEGTGRLNGDELQSRIYQRHGIGTEFSGCNAQGKKLMGITINGAFATLTKSDRYLTWEVPDNWSLEEAATVPVVYVTVLYCFFKVYKLKPGETILIHSGAGGIGQAAIQIALHHGCTVYTTVGTDGKREFLKNRFSKLNDKHIGNSRDTSFEQMICERTNGRGVDIVLNSLAEEKLLASIRCLAKGGNFFEIGKVDFVNNNPLKLMLLEKSATFYGIDLNAWFRSDVGSKQELYNIFKTALIHGYIKPIHQTIFKPNEIEKAFRYMMTGKHIGKVLIEIRPEEKKNFSISQALIKNGKAQYYCNSNASYIVVGGLGDFGLELTDWLVLRGARKLILTSRKGISNGYQSYKIQLWKSYGCQVKISLTNAFTKEGCYVLIEEANQLGPVAALFNLAALLQDAIFENQTIQSFQKSFESKAIATKFLDEISRNLCPQLKSFVVFSSIFCIGCNAGQTNYGMSNSVMERICEKRKKDGLPAVAIKWGAIGEVGIVARKDENNTGLVIGGTEQQKVSNCLEVLDILLNQNYPIVSSVVLAEKVKKSKPAITNNIVDIAVNIIGIRDLKTVNNHLPLTELGMDSLSGIEIKQTLEREFQIFFTTNELRKLTFAKLLEIQQEKSSINSVKKTMQ